MAVHRIGRCAENFGVELFEFVEAIRERRDFRRADEREIERIEEKDQPFAAVIAQAHGLAEILRARRTLVLGSLKSGAGFPTCANIVSTFLYRLSVW